ncbi:NAD(P)-binding domain-containing protein [uncultured Roseobacter sp.]|uniref:NAD(P)-dependent oxidoreductase n=1 Tax=uncultured Roseobacter sp. TaxID=114847 RepID=UPI00262761F2|nr:NAD(P)-binding domain-containing protein [uncultured Roseobacter sp.]
MIGVAGCGRMGGPMLTALRASGFDARGFDIRPLALPGTTTSAAEFSRGLKTLITVVRDIPQTHNVLFGEQAFAAVPGLERILICSTLSPVYVAGLRDLIPSHVTLVDAPMSGAQIAAEEARLTFMLGGDTAEIDAVRPMLNAMGSAIHVMGAFGAGMQAKVLNNLLAASSTAMTRLVLDWAEKSGLDPERLLALIHTSSGQNWFASGGTDIEFFNDGMDAENTIGILVKDIESALDAAPAGANTALPRCVRDTIRTLRPRG